MTNKITIHLKRILLVLSLMLISIISINSYANTPKTLRVGIVEPIPPFVISTQHAYSGISIDVWQRVASNANLSYQYILLNMNTDAAIELLHNGGIDVLIGPVSMTAERYTKVDFSYPYFLNSVGIIERNGPGDVTRIFTVFSEIIKSPFFIILLIFFLLYMHALWVVEKGRNPNVQNQYRPAMSDILWTHLLQKGARQIPSTLSGRMISLIWTIIAATFVTAVIAIVTAKLTTALVAKPENFTRISELQDQSVAAIKGTNAYTEIEKVGVNLHSVDNLAEAVTLLNEKKVVAVAEDYILAKHYLQTHNYSTLQLSSITLSNDQYAIAVQKDSPLLPIINRQILLMHDNDSAAEICVRYIGSDAKFCKL